MVITVYGPGCARCYETERLIRNVLAELQHDADLQKVSDYKAMAAAGVMAIRPLRSTASSRSRDVIPKREEVKAWLT